MTSVATLAPRACNGARPLKICLLLPLLALRTLTVVRASRARIEGKTMLSFLAAGDVAGAQSGLASRVRGGFIAAGFASILAGCSPPPTAPPPPQPINGSSGSGGDPTSSTGGGSGGGSGATTGTGLSWTCEGDAAYRATSTAFTSPTAEPLALALNELVFAYEARPIAIVLRQDGAVRQGAASATTDEGGAQVFAAPAPALGSLDEAAEGFGDSAPQPHGTLTVVQPKGPLSIALEEIRWRARPNDGCGSIWVSLDAVIPASEGATVLQLKAGTASLAELAATEGGPDGGLAGYPVHAWFLGESMAFDFTSLPVSP
jgi:hypothetical protein